MTGAGVFCGKRELVTQAGQLTLQRGGDTLEFMWKGSLIFLSARRFEIGS